VGERVLRAGAAVLIASLCIKLAGLLIKKVVANSYGLPVSDAFAVVNGTVLGTAFALGENCLGPAFMPVFAGAREKDGEPRAWRYVSVLFNLQFLILLAITASLMLFPSQIIAVFTQWDTAADAGESGAAVRQGLAVAMLPYLAPALVGMSLASLTYWVLVAYKR
jgi:peptidoglycan biosynthesis protein MviN/MurJ (putative lipid II flippase)